MASEMSDIDMLGLTQILCISLFEWVCQMYTVSIVCNYYCPLLLIYFAYIIPAILLFLSVCNYEWIIPRITLDQLFYGQLTKCNPTDCAASHRIGLFRSIRLDWTRTVHVNKILLTRIALLNSLWIVKKIKLSMRNYRPELLQSITSFKTWCKYYQFKMPCLMINLFHILDHYYLTFPFNAVELDMAIRN